METTAKAAVGEGDYENPWTYKGSTFTSADINGEFGFDESLEVADAGGRVRVTGKHTTDLLKNLMLTGNAWGRIPLPEKSSPPMPQQEE